MADVWVTQSCRVERWRGYFTSSFFVVLPDGTLVESKPFRWRHAAPPADEGPARSSYDELVARMVEAGWTVEANHSGDWFAAELTRLVEATEELPPQPVAPPAPPPDVPPPVLVPEARRVPAPAPTPPASTPPAPRRRPRIAFVTALLVVVVACIAVAAIALWRDASTEAAARTTSTRPARTPTSPAEPVARRAAPAVVAVRATPRVDLRITATATGSWLEVRTGSQSGPVLYSATLQAGDSVRFRKPRLWARFGAASNLSITVDGRPVRLQGTYDKLFVAPKATR